MFILGSILRTLRKISAVKLTFGIYEQKNLAKNNIKDNYEKHYGVKVSSLWLRQPV